VGDRTGLTPTAADVAEAHAHIRDKLSERLGGAAAKMRILYGGSVKTVQRGRIARGEKRRWRAGRRRQPESGGLSRIAEAYRSIA